MGKREDLHSVLVALLGNDNVYYQPPTNLKMKYPAIRYERSKIDNVCANDGVYAQWLSYTITVIGCDPDGDIIANLSKMSKCKHDRFYASDNLNHEVFTIYW